MPRRRARHDDVGPQGTIVTHLSNYGTIRNVGGSWLFWQMTFGSSAPISADTIYDS
jgi:hypothetical protein